MIALGGVLIMTPVAAYADWGDILGKILNAVTQILQQEYAQLKAQIEQAVLTREEGEKNRDKIGQEEEKNRKQQCDFWCGKQLPNPGTVPNDAQKTGSPGAAVAARRESTAKLQAITGSMADNLDHSTAIQGYYGAVTGWYQAASPDERRQAMQPPSFEPGYIPTPQENQMADYNAKLTIGLEPSIPASQDQINKNPAAQEYEARRLGYNSAQLAAYNSYRQYDMSAEEVKAVNDVLLSMSQETIEGMNPGTAMKAQVQLLAIQSGLLLSQYQSSLRQERLLAVMASNNAKMAMKERLRKLAQGQSVQGYAK
ncbi:hypothetical protein DK842_22710 [Chromobacterium phragmitis]|nr:hypothetical protein DK842_22710 [Chromobacterium phragmitis]